jgi:hypothetical protein
MKLDTDGGKHWLLNGELHRENGPAVELADGSKLWYINGKKHRENGPACEWVGESHEWWVNGTNLNNSQIKQLKIRNKLLKLLS